jgi:2-hydroxyacyl-CoA lyase 1
MGKGTLPDDHPLNVSAARSTALAGADVVVLVGARLNWILHYGQPPRYRKDVKFIKLDICAEEMHNGSPAAVALVGHARGVMAQLNQVIAADASIKVKQDSAWWQKLAKKVQDNSKASAELAADRSFPMNYYTTLSAIQQQLPRDAMIMSEGANTMDIGRTILMNYLPKSRLDAGSFGTMGVGLGQVLAFCLVHPSRKCVSVVGDSAFGFSGMEYETVCRYHLNALIIVLNNSGILSGLQDWKPEYDRDTEGALMIPPASLKPSNHYDKLTEVFGGRSWYAETIDELERQLPEAMASTGPGIFHIRISPNSDRKKQEFAFDPAATPVAKL